MLNLSFAMLSHKFALLLFFVAPLWLFQAAAGQPLSGLPSISPNQGEGPALIEAPRVGDVLQGIVAIRGTTDIPGFRSAEIDFSYQADPTHTWFLIQQGGKPVKEDLLASWDTTTITDGEYQLRVRVFLQDGKVQESVVSGLRVRNYTVIETSTPEAGLSSRGTPTPTSTPPPDFVARAANPTPLPTNPAQLTSQDLRVSAWQGVAAVMGLLLAAGVYLGLRWLARR
jgi:hypothetical protein